METINQVNNFQNSENETAQNYNGANISYQVNNYFNADNIYSINQNKYLEHFINGNFSLRNMKFGKEYVIDFYFYFLSNFTKENDFEKSLNEYINFQKIEQKNEDNLEKKILKIKEYEKEKYYRLKLELEELPSNFCFNNNNVRRKLIYEITNNLQKKIDVIKDNLSFIKNWDFEILFFINHLIKTDFESFINSNNNELLFHALGFLFYTNNNININQNIYLYDNEVEILYDYNVRIVEDIFNFIIENKDKKNINFLKYITSNPKNIYRYKQYFKIKEFLIKLKEIESNINFDEETINKIILNKNKLKKINKIINEFKKRYKKIDITTSDGIDEMKLNYFLNPYEYEKLFYDLNILLKKKTN
ncbi:MAG: hypothetical protein PHQ70_11770 [Arcobacter sp.]|uniref:hypothetical protein n=1 Tax=Arcobacter sp. TaxID=1872629 RepID=UPI002588D710|nr:hypothetical protein [Arcobacter sp.]MDD3009524.1 hypothetical protein [Arcobacter sp.]